MTIFHKLRVISEFRRHQMPFIESLVDMDLLREIGYHQVIGEPLTLSALFQQRIASVATVQRRLSRLKRIDMVRAVNAKHDRRLLNLELGPKAWGLYFALERKMTKVPRRRLGPLARGRRRKPPR